MAMKILWLCIAIISTYQSVHGQRKQRQRNPVNYEYVYYEYYDDYYDYGAPTGARHPPAATKARAPETQQQKPQAAAAADEAVDDAVGELPEYDLKEIVDAWKEYVKEKENKKTTEPEPFDYDLTGPPRRRPAGGQRFQATGVRGGTGFRGTGVRGGTGFRGTGVRGSGPRGQTGVRGGGSGFRAGSGVRAGTGIRAGTGVRGGSGFRGTRVRGSGVRGTGVRGTGVRGSGPRATGVRGGSGFRGTGVRGGAFVAYEDDYPLEEEIQVPVSNNRFNVEDLLTGFRGNQGNGGGQRVTSFAGGNRFQQESQAYECEPLEESYSTPDKKQCDKYYECNIKGEEKEKLCPDGLVYDIASQHCDYPAKVNCTGRPDLQEAQVSKNCPRANGFFPFPAEESCQKFWDCRGGKGYLQECPVGVIFDPKIDACVTPDQSARPECAAGKFLGFECPVYEKDEILRFGNHDRLPSPKNCQEFFTCLRTGQPRLGVCPKKTVFNSESGNCDKPETVKGCETYWKDKEAEELEEYYDY